MRISLISFDTNPSLQSLTPRLRLCVASSSELPPPLPLIPSSLAALFTCLHLHLPPLLPRGPLGPALILFSMVSLEPVTGCGILEREKSIKGFWYCPSWAHVTWDELLRDCEPGCPLLPNGGNHALFPVGPGRDGGSKSHNHDNHRCWIVLSPGTTGLHQLTSARNKSFCLKIP